MKVKDLNELYVSELRDLYSAETQIVNALPKIAGAVETPELKDAIYAHLEQTKGQVFRLESIFQDLGMKPTGNKCEATEGLLKEGSNVLDEIDKGAVRDAAIIGAAQRVEHYEIAAYGTARTFAELLGFSEHAALLQETLDEEFGANSALTDLAVSRVNSRAKNGQATTGAFMGGN